MWCYCWHSMFNFVKCNLKHSTHSMFWRSRWHLDMEVVFCQCLIVLIVMKEIIKSGKKLNFSKGITIRTCVSGRIIRGAQSSYIWRKRKRRMSWTKINILKGIVAEGVVERRWGLEARGKLSPTLSHTTTVINCTFIKVKLLLFDFCRCVNLPVWPYRRQTWVRQVTDKSGLTAKLWW